MRLQYFELSLFRLNGKQFLYLENQTLARLKQNYIPALMRDSPLYWKGNETPLLLIGADS